MIKFTLLLSFVGALALSSGAIFAQEPSGGFVFSCASWDRIDGPPIYYIAGKAKRDETPGDKLKRLESVDVPEMTRSLLYEFKSGRQVSFFRKVTGEEGEVLLDEVASVSVPSSWSRALFLFFPGKEKGAYRIFPIRDDRASAPFGSYQFVNLSELELSGFLDRNPISLKPKGKSIIKLTGDEKRSLDFGVWSMIDGKKKWMQRNTLTYRPQKYLIYFFYTEKDGQGRAKVRSKGIVDFKPPSEDEGRQPVESETGA